MAMHNGRCAALALVLIAIAQAPAHAAPMDDYALARQILKQFIETDTTHARGSTGLATMVAARATLARLIADPGVKLSLDGPIDPSPETRPSAAMLARYAKATAPFYAGAPIIPDRSTGASDSVYTRTAGIPSYASSTIAEDLDDHREHGRDERIRVRAFDTGLEYADRLLRMMSARD